jgi:hypothetical protein
MGALRLSNPQSAARSGAGTVIPILSSARPPPRRACGYAMFAEHIGQAGEGCDFDFRGARRARARDGDSLGDASPAFVPQERRSMVQGTLCFRIALGPRICGS